LNFAFSPLLNDPSLTETLSHFSQFRPVFRLLALKSWRHVARDF